MKYSFFTQNTAKPTIQYYLHHLVIIFLIGIVYYPTMDAPFIFDDFPNIVTNPAVHPESLRDILDVFQSKFSRTRPFALLTFSLNYLFGGLDVFGYHLVNILIHIAVTYLIYNIFINFPLKTNLQSKESENRYATQNISFWAASLWALNPIQTQAVTYIVQRMTSLATLFYLASIYIFIRLRNNSTSKQIAIPFIVSFFFLGMGCKEIVITLPLTLLLIDYLFYTKKTTKYHLVVMVFVFIGMIGSFFFYLNGKLPDFFSQSPNRNFSPWERVMTEWRVVWHYLSLYFLPLPHRMHLAYDVTISKGFLTPWTTLTSLIAIITSWYIAWKYRFKFPILSFAWFFFFLALTLESTFLPLEIAFSHRLYLPTIFIIFSLLASIPHNLFKKTSICFLLLLGLLSFWTITRNEEWNNPEHFWSEDLERGSSPARALNNKAAALIDSGNFETALEMLEQGLKSNPRYDGRLLLLYNKGSVLHYMRRFEEALKTFKVIAKEYGVYRDTYLFIGLILNHLNREDEVTRLVEEMIITPGMKIQGQILQADLYARENKFEDAEKILLAAINKVDRKKTEDFIRLKLELARFYLNASRPKDAYDIYLEIIELYPHNYFSWNQLLKMLVASGDTKKTDKVRQFLKSKGALDSDTMIKMGK